MEFTIKNKHLVTLGRFLHQVPLDSKESRERTKFLNACEDYITDLETRRVDLARKYASKDENGEPIIVEDERGGTEYEFEPEAKEQFTKEFEALMDGEFSLNIEEGNLTKVRTVKDIVLNTDIKLSGQLASEYDAWCEALESVDLS